MPARALDETSEMTSALFDRLRPIGFNPAFAAAFEAVAIDGAWPARVIEIQRETVALDDGADIVPARLHPSLARDLAGADLAVGDWVAAARDGCGGTWVHARLPPATQLARLDEDGRRRVLVSNVDLALIVMGLDGDFNPRRVERYLALVQGNGVRPVVVLTKLDCASEARSQVDALRGRLPRDVPVEAVDATAAAAADILAPYLGAGRTAVLLGSSGAGKSTLTNTLLGREVQPTGAVRAGDSRGRHTTCLRHRYAGTARAARRPRRGATGDELRRHRRTGPRLPLPRLPPRRRARVRGAGGGGRRPAAELQQALARGAARADDLPRAAPAGGAVEVAQPRGRGEDEDEARLSAPGRPKRSLRSAQRGGQHTSRPAAAGAAAVSRPPAARPRTPASRPAG